jgi:UDP-glucuronate 4-epimerase
LSELVEYLENALGIKARRRYLPDQPGDMSVTYADISRAKRVLGYAPKRPIKEGIQLFANWFLENKR